MHFADFAGGVLDLVVISLLVVSLYRWGARGIVTALSNGLRRLVEGPPRHLPNYANIERLEREVYGTD